MRVKGEGEVGREREGGGWEKLLREWILLVGVRHFCSRTLKFSHWVILWADEMGLRRICFTVISTVEIWTTSFRNWNIPEWVSTQVHIVKRLYTSHRFAFNTNRQLHRHHVIAFTICDVFTNECDILFQNYSLSQADGSCCHPASPSRLLVHKLNTLPCQRNSLTLGNKLFNFLLRAGWDFTTLIFLSNIMLQPAAG